MRQTLKTGQCQAGFHEGKKPKDWRGNPVQSCKLWDSCPCDCHASITEMYKLADMERTWVDNPEYVKPESSFYLPVFGVDYGNVESLAPVLTSDPVDLERPAPSTTRAYVPNPDGRAARGSLEDQVLEVCTEYMRNPPEDDLCTPQWISTQIAKKLHVPPPSTGAINAIFVRFTKWNFAIIAEKPKRFQMFTPEGAHHGRDYMKALYQRSH